MSLFDIYKAKTLGAGAGSLFDAKAGAKLNKDAWKKGFNKWDEEWENGIINSSGGNSPSDNYIRSKNFIPVQPDTTYCMTRPTDKQVYCGEYDESKTFVVRKAFSKVGNYVTFKTGESTEYIKFCIAEATYSNNICINISGDHDGEYVPYDGE